MLYVTGTLTNNGTIENSHGAYAEGQDVYLLKNFNGEYEYVPAVGASGASITNTSSLYNGTGHNYLNGNPGIDGTGRQTGGGGSGAIRNYVTRMYSGAGSAGTSYSGGSGGGAAATDY
jgi:hypothetical protein